MNKQQALDAVAAIRAGLRPEKDPGDYYSNKRDLAQAIEALLPDAEARRYLERELDMARYVGD